VEERSSLQVLLSVMRDMQDDVKDLIRSNENLLHGQRESNAEISRLSGKVETLERLAARPSVQSSARLDVLENAPASAAKRTSSKASIFGASAGVIAAGLIELAQALLSRPTPPPAPVKEPPAIVRQVAP
jgi:hypothetical protein